MYRLVHCDFTLQSFNPKFYWGIEQHNLEDGQIVIITDNEIFAKAKIHKVPSRKIAGKYWFEAELLEVLESSY